MDTAIQSAPLKPWDVIFWDVGQGDATSLCLPDGEYVLIDTGPISGSIGANPLVQWIRGKRIKFIIATHNDLDHIGGLISLALDQTQAIETVLLVNDKTFNDEANGRFKGLVDCLQMRCSQRQTTTQFLTQSDCIYSDASCKIAVRYPSALQTSGKKTNNGVSAIISLENNLGETLIVWGGDTLLSTISEHCSQTRPTVFVGPHHGAPQDAIGKDENLYRKCLTEISPKTLYVSVGRGNKYGHPRKGYVQAAATSDITICCSEIAEQCRPKKCTGHIFDGSFRIGLPVPKNSVQCRGSMRVSVNPDGVEFDLHQADFLRRVDAVENRMCKTRISNPAMQAKPSPCPS